MILIVCNTCTVNVCWKLVIEIKSLLCGSNRVDHRRKDGFSRVRDNFEQLLPHIICRTNEIPYKIALR